MRGVGPSLEKTHRGVGPDPMLYSRPVMIDFLTGMTPLQSRLLAQARAIAEDDNDFLNAKVLLQSLACTEWQMDESAFEQQCDALDLRVMPISAYAPGSVGYAYRTLLQMGTSWHCRYPYFDLSGMCGDLHDDEPSGPEGVSLCLSRFTQIVLPVGRAPRLPVSLLNGGELPNGARIPAHNLDELWMAIEQVRQEPETPLTDILQILPGPDFAVPCVCHDANALQSFYDDGKGMLTLRAHLSVELSGWRTRLAITALPPGVLVQEALAQIRAMVTSGEVVLFHLKDASRREQVRIVLDAPRDWPAARLKEILFRQTAFSIAAPAILSETGGGLISHLKAAVAQCSSPWERRDGGSVERIPTLREIQRTGGYKSPLRDLIDPRRSRILDLDRFTGGPIREETK